MPRQDRSRASVIPTGPPPTISTLALIVRGRSIWRLARGERRHYFARKAAQPRPAPFPRAGTASVQQQIAGAGLAQRLKLPRDFIRRAVDCARQVDLDRIAVRAIRSTEDPAVGRRCQLELPKSVGEPSFQRCL